MSPRRAAQRDPDEAALLRLERDAALEHVALKDAYIADLLTRLAAPDAEIAELQRELEQLERMRRLVRRVPGGGRLARFLRRLLLR